MHERLSVIDDELMWEFGPAIGSNGHRLVITPESSHELRPMVDEILKRAPKLPGWEFYTHRPAEDWETVLSTVQGRSGYSPDRLEFRASINRFRGIDLLFQGPEVSGPDDQRWLSAVFVTIESFLGEEVLDKWIGAVEVQRRPGKIQSLFSKSQAGFAPVQNLQSTVEALINGIRDQMPDTPYFRTDPRPRDQGRTWSILELKPKQQDDYPECSDLFIASTCDVPLFEAVNKPTFTSSRFSKVGETFCYLKIDGSARPAGREAEYRGNLDDAVNDVLNDLGLGCSWGGGSVYMYCYIDLALVDVVRSIEPIRECLQRNEVPRRSWLLFHDADLAQEWVGIYDPTPPPPKAEPSDDEVS